MCRGLYQGVNAVETARGTPLSGSCEPSAGCVNVHREATETRIVLAGELDLLTARGVRTALNAECARGSSTIVVDLSALEFIDGTGVRALCEVFGRLAGEDRSLHLVDPPAHVRRVFELVGADELFTSRVT